MKNLRLISFDDENKIQAISEYIYIHEPSQMITKKGNLIKQLSVDITYELSNGYTIKFEWSPIK